MEKRKVQVLKSVAYFDKEAGITKWQKQADYIGTFHTWGCSYEEFESGPGNFTCAVIEKEDGQVEMIDAGFVKFMDKDGAREEMNQ